MSKGDSKPYESVLRLLFMLVTHMHANIGTDAETLRFDTLRACDTVSASASVWVSLSFMQVWTP